MTAQEQRQHWLREQAGRAAFAIRQLNQAKKQICTDYDDRLRTLRKFQEQLGVQAADIQQAELLDQAAMLTPSIQGLLDAPLAGLDD